MPPLTTGAAPGQPHHYRLQDPELLIEYDKVQRRADHAHSVWRDPESDFGHDVLRGAPGGAPRLTSDHLVGARSDFTSGA